jgi:hypothetical protein
LEELDGELQLLLYYSANAFGPTKKYFQALVELFLSSRKVAITACPPVSCAACGRRQQRTVVLEFMRERRDSIHCANCAAAVPLPEIALGVPGGPSEAELRKDKNFTRLKTSYEEALVPVKRLASKDGPRKCFVSYAREAKQRWVEAFVRELKIAGMDVHWDEGGTTFRHGTPGRFVSTLPELDFVLVIGTREYLRRSRNDDPERGYWLGAERDLIDSILGGAESQKNRVLPILLEGEPKESFPPLVAVREYFDFRIEAMFFPQLYDLVLRLFSVSPDADEVKELRDALRRDAERRGGLR